MAKLPDAAERAAIWRYVHEMERVGNDLHTTSFRAALRDARKLAGRHVDTGVIENDPIAVWPYAHMYLILMDQVGKVIRPASSARRTTSKDLRTALREFDSGLDQTDLDMMYALRCAFGHEFAMANEGRHLDQPVDPLRHRFQLTESTERKLVVYNDQWNGKYGSASVGGPTEVNLTELANVVERVVSDIEQRVVAGDVRLVIGVNLEMVLHRWGFRVLNYFG